MAFGLWVHVAIALVAISATASRTEERSFRNAISSNDLEPPHVAETAHISNQTTNMAVAKGLSPAAKVALHKLLHDLASIGFGVKKGPTESKDQFMPKCLAHVQEVVATVDRHYTDAQLESVLQHECQLSKEFPASHSSNFHSHEACMEFASKLADARMKELETGETAQYEQFCAEYYEHAATGTPVAANVDKKEAPKAAPPAKKPASKPEPAKSGAIVAGLTMGAVCAAFH